MPHVSPCMFSCYWYRHLLMLCYSRPPLDTLLTLLCSSRRRFRPAFASSTLFRASFVGSDGAFCDTLIEITGFGRGIYELAYISAQYTFWAVWALVATGRSPCFSISSSWCGTMCNQVYFSTVLLGACRKWLVTPEGHGLTWLQKDAFLIDLVLLASL